MARGLLTCRRGVWDGEDFTRCFRHKYMQTALPIALGGISGVILAAVVARHMFRSARRGRYQRIDDLDHSSDTSTEAEHEIFARAMAKDDAPASHVDYHQSPRLDRLTRVVETISVWALVTMHIVEIFYSRHRISAIVQAVFWLYTAILITIKDTRILNPTWTRTIFKHVAILVCLTWVVAFFELRSSLLRKLSQFSFMLDVFNFTFVSVISIISLTERFNTEPYPNLSSKGLPATHEPIASVLSLAGFNWVDPVIWRGFKQPHEMETVWDLNEELHAQSVLQAFTAARKASNLMWTLTRHFRTSLMIQGFWAGLYSLFTFVPTLLLREILQYLEAPEQTPRGVAWLYCVGLLLGSTLSTIGNGQSLWIGRKICIQLRAIIIGEVYAKSLRRRDASASGEAAENSEGQANQGQIINLMAIDAFKVAEICSYLHLLLAGVPIELVVAIVLLYSLLGWSALAGVVGMVLLLPFNYWISKQFAVIQDELMKKTDIRINRMNELLNSIRIVKYFAWENRFMADVSENRRNELQQLKRRFIMFSIASLSWNSSPVIITLLTFYAYTKLAGNDLTASIAFTALSLFNVLRTPLDQLADMISNVLQSKVSLDRVEAFLNEEETQKYNILRNDPTVQGPEIGFVDATFSWTPLSQIQADNEAAGTFKIRDLSIDFPAGTLSIVCGPTGSGKTSLLLALLGEMTLTKGSAFLPGARDRQDSTVIPGSELIDCVAYCAQQAWLLNDTIRNNILFATEFDERRYRAVLTACALDRDLEILELGDRTEIGEKGITLSGGQKQRVSLARALYSRARHLLLDDCLSAVDSHTAKWIFANAITGALVEDRTRILVTHNTALTLPEANHVVYMDNGRVKAQGTAFELIEQGVLGEDDDALRNAVSLSNSRANSRAPSRVQSKVQIADALVADEAPLEAEAIEAQKQVDQQKAGEQEKKRLIQEETRALGSVGWHVYSSYLKSLGGPIYWVAIAVAFVGNQGVNFLQSWWIREWALSFDRPKTSLVATTAMSATTPYMRIPSFFVLDSSRLQSSAFQVQEAARTFGRKDDELNYYLGVYALIALSYGLIVFIRIVVVSLGSIRASRIMHDRLLEGVLRSRMRFFDSTPLGRILNRFSKDMETIDQEIAIIAHAFLHDTIAVLSIVALISFITPGFLVAGAAITLLYSVVGVFYVRSSRELKRLESVTRSPIYQHFGETLAGVTTIRAYGLSLGFIRDNLNKIDTNSRPFYYLWACNRWLSVRVDLGGALVSFFAAVFIILNVDTIDAGLAGISLTYAITFTDHILWCVRLYALNEMNMNSVERVTEYLELESEAPADIPERTPAQPWPSKGAIDVDNLVLQYAPELPAVLKGISFKVEPGSKVGIVGRTGAGKSTIATGFFRLVEATSGSILVDGVDISKIGLSDLRRGLIIIPQDPTLFQRSLRFNLDPFNEHTDMEIFEALRRVHLIDSTADAMTAASKTNGNGNGTGATMHTETPVDGAVAPEAEATGENVNVFYNLETPVAEGGGNLSQGQRQLLCLARALLRLPKIIFLDESTASVDYATDAKIQKTIRASFRDSTILTIAHRLRSICDYDRILVLDQGKVVEYDHPYELMTKKDSLFRDMCEHSGEFDVLLDMAKEAFDKGPLLDVR